MTIGGVVRSTMVDPVQEHGKGHRRHDSLCGPERLFHVVQCLGSSCPWTKSVDSTTMLKWLEGEVHELRDELLFQQQNIPKVAETRRSEIVSELGDILFDALMLELMCKREFGLNDNEAWDTAAAKVERRTPYMKEWGDGSVANSVQDTERFWQAAKEQEPKKQKLTKRDLELTRFLNYSLLNAPTMIVGAVGFGLGLLVASGGRRHQ